MTALVIRKHADKVATQWEAIKGIRDRLQTIVTLADGWQVDADTRSIITMRERIDMWGVGAATMVDGKQLWKGYNNDLRFFTQAEFSAFVEAVRNAAALRVDTLFAYAEGLRALLPVADTHPMFQAESWPQ